MRRTFLWIWVAFAGIFIFFWAYMPTLSKYRDLKIQQEEIERKIQALDKKIQRLAEERHLLKNDKEYLEKIIRDQLGLVKPGEIVYKFVTEEPAKEPLKAPAASEPAPANPSAAVSSAPKPVASSRDLPLPNLGPGLAPKKPLPAGTEPVYPRQETR